MIDFLQNNWRILCYGGLIGALAGTYLCFNYARWGIRKTIMYLVIIFISGSILFLTK